MMNNQLQAPTRIPHDIKMVAEREAPPQASFGVAGMEGLGGSSGGAIGSLFGSGNAPKVKAEAPKKVNISAGVAVGMLLQKRSPFIRRSQKRLASPVPWSCRPLFQSPEQLKICASSVDRPCCNRPPWMP